MHLHDDIACIECDLIMAYAEELKPNQCLACPRCGHVLARGARHAVDTVLALSLTAIMALIASISFSFLSLNANGVSNDISLFSISSQLYQTGFGMLALIVIAFMVLLPCVYLVALIVLAIRAKHKVCGAFSINLANLICKIGPWIMVDVFIFGVLVALIKLVGMADIGFGVSFWSYVIFTLLFVQITLIVDTHRLWHWVEYGD